MCGVRDFVVPPLHKKSQISLLTNKACCWEGIRCYRRVVVGYRRVQAPVRVDLLFRSEPLVYPVLGDRALMGLS